VIELVSPFLRLKDKNLKKRSPLAAAVFHALSNKKKYIYVERKSTENFWRRNEPFFDPCFVDISLKLHGIGLKILP